MPAQYRHFEAKLPRVPRGDRRVAARGHGAGRGGRQPEPTSSVTPCPIVELFDRFADALEARAHRGHAGHRRSARRLRHRAGPGPGPGAGRARRLRAPGPRGRRLQGRTGCAPTTASTATRSPSGTTTPPSTSPTALGPARRWPTSTPSPKSWPRPPGWWPRPGGHSSTSARRPARRLSRTSAELRASSGRHGG